eukprot:scaffold2479_cov146-Isochrysis_galbana.AAC.4
MFYLRPRKDAQVDGHNLERVRSSQNAVSSQAREQGTKRGVSPVDPWCPSCSQCCAAASGCQTSAAFATTGCESGSPRRTPGAAHTSRHRGVRESEGERRTRLAWQHRSVRAGESRNSQMPRANTPQAGQRSADAA